MSRRWFVTPELLQWKHMVACGEYAGPFFSFPNHPSGIDPWEQNRGMRVLRGGLDPDLFGIPVTSCATAH